MNRNDIVKKLMSEGFTEKTLVNMSDKQLQVLSERIITTTQALEKNPKLQQMAKDTNPNAPTIEVKEDECDECDKTEMKEEKPSVGLSKKQKHKKVTPAAKWVDGVVKENYHVMTTKNEITSLIKQKLNEQQTEKDPKLESDTETTVYADGVSMDQMTAQKIANSNCKMKFMGKFPNKKFIKIIEKAHRTKDGYYRYEVGLKVKEEETPESEQKTGELKEQGIAPAKPKVTPTTKPGEKPKTRNPYQPGPGKNPDPKANIPNWMKFDNIKK